MNFLLITVLKVVSPLKNLVTFCNTPKNAGIPNLQSSCTRQKNGPKIYSHQVPETYECYLIWIKGLCR